MVNQSRRQRVQFEVTHAIRTDNHGSLLLVESIDDGLQRFGRRIQVVRIQLNGKASALRTINRHIPATANAEVGALRNDDVELVAMSLLQVSQDVGSSIGGVIVDHDDIVFKAALLRKGTLHGVLDRLDTIEHRDDNRSFHIELLFVEIDGTILVRVNQRLYFAQMGCAGLLHLYLHLTVARIDIVELLHA